jgi:hypothetical protein
VTYSQRVSPYLRGGDPAPGESGEIRRVLRGLRQTVEATEAATQVLQAVGVDAQLWTGSAADAFVAKRGELLRRLGTADQAYTDAANALERWLHQLEDAQDEAARIVQQAEAVMRQQPPPDPNSVFALTPAVPPALQAVQRRHDTLATRADADARCCAQALRVAAGSVGRYADSWWENVTNLLTAASDLLEEVTPWLGLLALAVPVLAPWVLAVDVLALTIDVVLAVDGKGSWTDVAGSALSVGLGVMGRTGKVMASSARQATTFEAAGFTHAGAHVVERTTLKGAASHAGAVFVHPIRTLRDGRLVGTALAEAEGHVVPGTVDWTTHAGAIRLGDTLETIGDIGGALHDSRDAGSQVGSWVAGQLRPDEAGVCR